VTTTTTVSAGTVISSLLAFLGSAAMGIAITNLVQEAKKDNEDTEIFYRAMSDAEFAGLGPKGEISIKDTENFVSQSPEYVLQLAARHPDKYQKLVVYVMESGTKNALISSGARSNGVENFDPSLTALPHISSFPKNHPDIVHIKGELGTITYGLRKGTVNIFNSRIIGSISTPL
jgi:hypothetical protein